MEALHERARERVLGVARRRAGRRALAPRAASNHVSIASSGSDSVRPYISPGASVMPMWLPTDFDIFSAPSTPGQDRHGQHACSGWP